MRRILGVAVLVAFAMGVSAFAFPIEEGAWERLPDDQKVELRPDGLFDSGLVFQVFILTCDNYRIVFDDPETNCSAAQLFSHILGDRVPLMVIIRNPTERSRRFYTTRYGFTQQHMKWDVNPEHRIFGDRDINPGEVAIGLLGIPEDLDHSQTFWVWYGDLYGVVAAGS